MKDPSRINEGLLEENSFLRQKIKELEQSELLHGQVQNALQESEMLQRILLANLPAGVIIIDPVARMIEYVNNTAATMFGSQAEHVMGHRCHAFLCPASEGACPVLDLGKEVDNSEREMVCANGSRHPVLKSVKRVQIRGQERLLECFVDIADRKRAEEERERLVLELREALSQVKTLHGLLPICSYCKKILGDEGCWEQMEVYIKDHSEANFSHGICPDCMAKYYPDYHPVDK